MFTGHPVGNKHRIHLVDRVREDPRNSVTPFPFGNKEEAVMIAKT